MLHAFNNTRIGQWNFFILNFHKLLIACCFIIFHFDIILKIYNRKRNFFIFNFNNWCYRCHCRRCY